MLFKEFRSYFKENTLLLVIFVVLAEVIMKSVIFLGVTPYLLVRLLSNPEDVGSSEF
jgi:hypothetical protein